MGVCEEVGEKKHGASRGQMQPEDAYRTGRVWEEGGWLRAYLRSWATVLSSFPSHSVMTDLD